MVILVDPLTAHCPDAGVKVYAVVTVLSIAGAHDPVIPFKEVRGKAGIDVPEQYGPTAAKLGVTGVFTTTVTAFDAGDVQDPEVVVTVDVPGVVTVIDGGVAPFDQVFPVAEDEVRTTDPPEQNVVAPPAVITGAEGAPGEVRVVFRILETQPVDEGVNVIS